MRAIRLRADNLVPRPWGGFALAAFKGLPDAPRDRIGESFEVSAFPADAEAGAHPSIAVLDDGTERPLPELLRQEGTSILGEALARRHGGALPLLPKFLDVQTMLSIQSHPAGNPECYVVLAADPGASLRVGFRRDVEAQAIVARCRAGRAAQERLLECLAPAMDVNAIQERLAPALANRAGGIEGCRAAIEPLTAGAGLSGACDAALGELFATYWTMLDAMHEIPVSPGQVIFNATPGRLRAGGVCSAEVHALGNPEGREILLLEIRKPGPTFRLWDHARVPLRPLQIEEALGSLNLGATAAADFVAGDLRDTPPGRVRTLVECPDFAVDHLRVAPGRPLEHATAGGPVTLHVIEGIARVRTAHGDTLLSRGASALVGASAGQYAVDSAGEAAAVVAARVRAPQSG